MGRITAKITDKFNEESNLNLFILVVPESNTVPGTHSRYSIKVYGNEVSMKVSSLEKKKEVVKWCLKKKLDPKITIP